MNSSADKVYAVILAGAPPQESPAGLVNRAMIPVGGKTMLQWEVDALRASQTISRVYAVGDVEADGLDRIIKPTDTFLGNIVAGVSNAADDGARSVLVACSDIPLITSECIDDFITRALDLNADFCYPIISKQDCIRKYPGMRRTYLKLREGVFTGGNMVLVTVDFIRTNSDMISQAYDARKNVLRLAGMIGWGTLARALIAQLAYPAALNILTLESTVSKMLNGNARAVITSHAEIGEDVDKPEDLEAIEKLLAVN